jgi:anthranilate phosphoribosyltransferase
MCFLFAQAHHPAMRHVAPVRKELGFRTLFNLLGPLSNPAGVTRQLLGVFDRAWLETLARTLQTLGAEKAWIVHGSDGLDELTLTGPTYVAALEHGRIRAFEVTPDEAGLERAPLSEIRGGSAGENAEAIRTLLSGARGAFRDIVLLNAAAALIVAGKCETLRDGAGLAAAALDSGAAQQRLERLISLSRAYAAS